MKIIKKLFFLFFLYNYSTDHDNFYLNNQDFDNKKLSSL